MQVDAGRTRELLERVQPFAPGSAAFLRTGVMRSVGAMLLVLLAACGGRADDPNTGRDGGGADAGWTECASPAGYAICGGAHECPADGACQNKCGVYNTPRAYPILCQNGPFQSWADAYGGVYACPPCGDGNVCSSIEGAPYPAWCVPFEAGVILARGGATVAYGDGSSFTGQPIPTSAQCPPAGSARYCGAGCGTCSGGEACVGTSPIHAVGFCFPKLPVKGSWVDHTCNAMAAGICRSGEACFIFTVQPEAQADYMGFCLPEVTCSEVATTLGGRCVPRM